MALKGNQKKLDKNNNNRIDAQDFKILKAEKAKGRGQGLQDEKMKPGKTMAAKKGGMFKGYSKVFETAAKAGQKNTGTSTIVGVKPNPKKPRKTYKSMEEMRKAKGFKPGESAKDFNKRQMLKREALKAAKATRLGKIVLPIAAAGVAAQQYLKSKMNKKDKKMGGGMMQKYAVGGPAEQARRMGQRKPKPGPLGRAGRGVGKATGRRAGIPSLPGKRKEDSSVTLGKFMKSKVDALNESVAAGGMKKERVTEGSRMRRKYDFIKDVEAGKYKKPNKDAAYYKSIGLTGARGDKAVDNFFKPRNLKMNVGGSVTVKTKLGKNKPTKMY